MCALQWSEQSKVGKYQMQCVVFGAFSAKSEAAILTIGVSIGILAAACVAISVFVGRLMVAAAIVHVIVVGGLHWRMGQWQRLLRARRCIHARAVALVMLLLRCHITVDRVECIVCIRRIILPGRIWYQFILSIRSSVAKAGETERENFGISLVKSSKQH